MNDRADWDELAGWWVEEMASDRAYTEQVLPLLLDLLAPAPGSRYVDLGCGEGRVMRAVAQLGARVVGCDLSEELLRRALQTGPVVRCRLPELDWVRPGSFDGGYASLVLEHLPDAGSLFTAARRAVRAGGVLVLVVNHPFFTAPGSGPVVDPTDGEVFWRWGRYLDGGSTEEPAGEVTVTFHHRSLAELLNMGASAGWKLERVVELGVTDDTLLAGQEQIPRLLGIRWQNPGPVS